MKKYNFFENFAILGFALSLIFSLFTYATKGFSSFVIIYLIIGIISGGLLGCICDLIIEKQQKK